jgi:hypothetical protein
LVSKFQEKRLFTERRSSQEGNTEAEIRKMWRKGVDRIMVDQDGDARVVIVNTSTRALGFIGAFAWL